MAKIEWNKITWYSKLLAVVLFLVVFAWAFHLGREYEQMYEVQNNVSIASTNLVHETLINNVAFKCDAGKTIQAQFMQNNLAQGSVALELSDGRTLVVPQSISADGARYATPDDSFVFWDKGNGSFIEEGAPYATSTPATTYSGCMTTQ